MALPTVGASAGALLAVLRAAGLTGAELERLALDLQWKARSRTTAQIEHSLAFAQLEPIGCFLAQWLDEEKIKIGKWAIRGMRLGPCPCDSFMVTETGGL